MARPGKELDFNGMDSLGRIDAETIDDGAREVGSRGRKRDSLFMSAQLTIAGKARVDGVRVRNLSEGGLMAEYDSPVAPGAAVTLEMRGLGELSGRVAWCTHGRIGIAFDQPIDPSRARKPVGTGRNSSEYPKPVVFSARRN